MATIDPIDIRAGTKRQALVAKILRDRYPGSEASDYVREAEVILLALDEYDSDGQSGNELEELRAAGALLTAAQNIRLEIARMLTEYDDVESVGGTMPASLSTVAPTVDEEPE